jgi:hypothetical protein
MSDEIRLNYENNGQGRVPATYNQHLPSTELRGAIPGWEDGEEIHLRDYLDVLMRRKWLIICILALSFITTLIFTLASTKIYKATTTIEVTQETSQVTKFEEVVAAEVKAREFYETQVALLRSQALIERVIEKLNLMTNPIVVEILFSERNPGISARIKELIKSFLPQDREMANHALLTQETLRRQALFKYISQTVPKVCQHAGSGIYCLEDGPEAGSLSDSPGFSDEADRPRQNQSGKDRGGTQPLCQAGRDCFFGCQAEQHLPAARGVELVPGSGRIRIDWQEGRLQAGSQRRVFLSTPGTGKPGDCQLKRSICPAALRI